MTERLRKGGAGRRDDNDRLSVGFRRFETLSSLHFARGGGASGAALALFLRFG